MKNNLVSESVAFMNWRKYISDQLKEMGRNLESGDIIKPMNDPNLNPLTATTNIPRLNLKNII